MKSFIYILVLITFSSCYKQSDHKVEFNKDSSLSKITIIPKKSLERYVTEITNTLYSIENFYYNQKWQKYACKTTVNERVSYGGLKEYYSEKKEFYDFELIKVFEIEAFHRKIELKSNYYIARDLYGPIPNYFELFNYSEKEPFVKCTGRLWTAEVPNSENKAYFGYRKSSGLKMDSYPVFGNIYYSVNQTTNYKIAIKAANKELFNKITHIMGIKLEPNNPTDKFSRLSELSLWSKKGIKNITGITDFNIVITVGYQLSDHDIDNNETKYLKIPVIDGKIYGKKSANNTYEYVIKE